jgi:tRNA modification GTPase
MSPYELWVSAETGEGLADLLDAITRVVTEQAGERDEDAPILTHTRQRFAVACALGELESFRQAWCSGAVPATVAAVHVREAGSVLEELIGAVEIEDVLDEVFRRFCVGK